MRELEQIKESELRYGKLLISFIGTMNASKEVGSYHAVRRIQKLDHRITLEKLFWTNSILERKIFF